MSIFRTVQDVVDKLDREEAERFDASMRANMQKMLPPAPPGSDLETVTVTGQRGPAFTAADKELLARMIFTEGAEHYLTPGLFEAIGSTAINRIGQPGFKNNRNLASVINNPGAFQGIGKRGTPAEPTLWDRSAPGGPLDGPNRDALERARLVASGLLDGTTRDPTQGATYLYSQNKPSDPLPEFFRANQARPDDDPKKLTRTRPNDGQVGKFTFMKEPSPYRTR